MGRTANGTIDSTTFDARGARCASARTRSAATPSISITTSARGRRGGPANGYPVHADRQLRRRPGEVGHHHPQHALRPGARQCRLQLARRVNRHRRWQRELQRLRPQFRGAIEGSGDATPRGGYGGGGPDPGSEGSAFWFSGPNNYIRNNVAANADAFGFSLAGPAAEMRVPAAAGADMLRASETKPLDPSASPVLEFSNNEAYGATQIGVDCNWNGLISKVTVWNVARNGIIGLPSARLVIDGLVARGDSAVLADAQENPTGVWLGNYIGRGDRRPQCRRRRAADRHREPVRLRSARRRPGREPRLRRDRAVTIPELLRRRRRDGIRVRRSRPADRGRAQLVVRAAAGSPGRTRGARRPRFR